MRKSKGFTLIELLVVIAIIGILATLVVVNLSQVRVKARDAKRKSDLDSIRTAIEMYIEENGIPPGDEDRYESRSTRWNDLQTILSSYISVLPKDPLNGRDMKYVYGTSCNTATTEGRYRYERDGADYEIESLMEKDCDAVMEDGGNHDRWYEIGSNLDII